MDKILVEVICPATSRHYDFWISKRMQISQVIEKLIAEIQSFEKTEILFYSKEKVCLYSKKRQKAFSKNISVIQAGINSGDILMLI